MDLKFIKDRYDYELQRKEQLTSALTLPVAALSLLGGAVVAMARSFTYHYSWLTGVFVTTLVADVLAFVVCLVCLIRAYHRQSYVFLPLLKDLDSWEEEYRQFVRYVESTGGEATEREPSLRERIIDAADRNTRNNDARSGLLYWARVWLFAVLAVTATAGISYVIDQVSIAMPRSEPTTLPPPQRPAQSTSPQPPAPPPNRVIREGDAGPRPQPDRE